MRIKVESIFISYLIAVAFSHWNLKLSSFLIDLFIINNVMKKIDKLIQCVDIYIG